MALTKQRLFCPGETNVRAGLAVRQDGVGVGKRLAELFLGKLAGTGKVGAAQVGGEHFCAPETGLLEARTPKPSATKIRLTKISFRENAVYQLSRSEIGVMEARERQLRADDLAAPEFCAGKIDAGPLRIANLALQQAGVVELCGLEFRGRKIRRAEARMVEMGVVQPRAIKGALNATRIVKPAVVQGGSFQ